MDEMRQRAGVDAGQFATIGFVAERSSAPCRGA
jgi:hypothetical protein